MVNGNYLTNELWPLSGDWVIFSFYCRFESRKQLITLVWLSWWMNVLVQISLLKSVKTIKTSSYLHFRKKFRLKFKNSKFKLLTYWKTRVTVEKDNSIIEKFSWQPTFKPILCSWSLFIYPLKTSENQSCSNFLPIEKHE